MFSAYTHRLQKFVDILEKLPNYKYIVSKGPNGDQLVMPSERFIGLNCKTLDYAPLTLTAVHSNCSDFPPFSTGENFIDQIGVLQVVAAEGGCMITHGGRLWQPIRTNR